MTRSQKEIEILRFVKNSIHKTLDGVDDGILIHLGGHSIKSLQGSTDVPELIDIIVNLVVSGDLVQVTRQEDTFDTGKLDTNRYFTISKQGELRLKPFYQKFPIKFWHFLKSDGYVILSITSTILAIISIVITLSGHFHASPPKSKSSRAAKIQNSKTLPKATHY